MIWKIFNKYSRFNQGGYPEPKWKKKLDLSYLIKEYILLTKTLKLYFEKIIFGKSVSRIEDMQHLLFGFWNNFVLGRCPIGKVRNHPINPLIIQNIAYH